MDGILALCHFCESHGPCVILCTQKTREEPLQHPHNLTAPWCEACQSLELGQTLVSFEDGTHFVTTRIPLQQDLAFLLKQAAVRSLSCEEATSKDDGTLYFGDNERGHVFSHTFTLCDSLARGFHRKYSILMLMRDKVYLLNMWPVLKKHVRELAKELQEKAANVNELEQVQKPQRAVRQAQGIPKNTARSLSQLTGEPAIFGHIHLWFCWILNYKAFAERPVLCLPLVTRKTSKLLPQIAKKWPRTVFQTICFCILTGTKVASDEADVLRAFQTLLPESWPCLLDIPKCKLIKKEVYEIEWCGKLPPRLPTYQVTVEKALLNESLPESALEPYLHALLLRWLNIAKSMVWCQNADQDFLKTLGVQNHDLPMLNYWTKFCDKYCLPH